MPTLVGCIDSDMGENIDSIRSNSSYVIKFAVGAVVRIYGLKREGGELFKRGFWNLFDFNKILCMNPEQKPG